MLRISSGIDANLSPIVSATEAIWPMSIAMNLGFARCWSAISATRQSAAEMKWSSLGSGLVNSDSSWNVASAVIALVAYGLFGLIIRLVTPWVAGKAA